jgi:hypothetical protein|tara:strand:- start:1231 stop:1335 length:105 start_codon:yes stop_codon:yes gene_type:complete
MIIQLTDWLFWAMVSSWLCFGFLLGFWWGERGIK